MVGIGWYEKTVNPERVNQDCSKNLNASPDLYQHHQA